MQCSILQNGAIAVLFSFSINESIGSHIALGIDTIMYTKYTGEGIIDNA